MGCNGSKIVDNGRDGSFEPSAGQIIFFDWDNKGSSGPQDGGSPIMSASWRNAKTALSTP